MKSLWRFRTTAALAGWLIIPLWLGSCTVMEERRSTGVSVGSAAGPVQGPAPQPLPAPVPHAQEPPTPATPPAPVSGAAASPQTSPLDGGTSGSVSPEQPVPERSAQAAPVPADPGRAPATSAPRQAPGRPAADPPPSPEPIGTSKGTSVYYVSIDDGGTGGVRFGCNDSLVAVPLATPLAGEPLQSSLRALLPGSPGGSAPTPDGLYNSLASSTLAFVSGYFDGATVVVNLSGTIQSGGACDIPRVEAQLTHTAVAAVGATRAEIYIDGRSLSEVLSLR